MLIVGWLVYASDFRGINVRFHRRNVEVGGGVVFDFFGTHKFQSLFTVDAVLLG